MKIGVLADTHIPDRVRVFPPRILEIFASVELVLHAGDITSPEMLDILRDQIGLTFAVYGDRDPPQLRAHLQSSQVLEFGGRRVGLIHGHRDSKTEFNLKMRRLLRRDRADLALTEYLLERFGDVDAIVFGHTHVPYAKTHGSVFLFNPGSILPREGSPSVGLLEIDNRGIRGRIVPL